MFDLFRSRDKIVKYVLGGLLTLVALSMVTYLIPSYNTPGFSDNSIVADVGGKKMTAQWVQQQFQNAMKGQTIPPEMMDVYLPEFIQQLLLTRAAAYQAERMGLSINDDELLTALILSNPQFFKDGVLTSKEALEQSLAQQGMTLQDYLDDVRQQLALRKLQNALLETSVVTPKEIEEDFARKYDRAKIQYIAFPTAKLRDQVKLDEAEVRRNFDGNRNLYTQPEKYTFQVLVVDQTKVEASIQVSEQQLRAAYSGSMDNFRMPERVHVRHILLKTDGRTDAEKKSLMSKAQDLVKQAKGGADFFELAKKNSDDAAEKGGDLGWLVRGQAYPEVEKAAFALKSKEIGGPVTSPLGIHVIQVLEHEEAHVKPFEEVRADLAKEVRQRAVADKVQQLTGEVHAALLKDPKAASEIAKQYAVEDIHVAKSELGQAIPGLGVSPEIGGVLPSLQPGQVSDILVLPSERIAMVALESKDPPRQAEFDEVKDKVRTKLMEEGAMRLADGLSKDAAERLRKGEDMAKVAKSMKLEMTTSSEFGVADSVEGLGSAVYMEDAFKKPVGTIIGPQVIQTQTVVAKVIAKTPANMSALAAERETLLKELKSRKARERNDLMLDSILTKLEDEGKVKVYRDQINKLIADYRKQR